MGRFRPAGRAVPAAFTFPSEAGESLVATAIHAGHQLRPEIRERLVLDQATRLREEDPFTDVIAAGVGAPVMAHRSRFEVDVNRPRHEAVYRRPADAWGLHVWRDELPADVVKGSLELYDAFYQELGRRLDQLAERGPFVVFDVHSYNHRRDGAEATPAPAAHNPDVNVGTGSMDRRLWEPVVDGLIGALRCARVGGEALDVRENVRFRGANLASWVHERYPETGCAVALEFKKTFMDEWSGEVYHDRLVGLRDALRASVPVVRNALERVPAS
jgi:N-formylglutamate deformylase